MSDSFRFYWEDFPVGRTFEFQGLAPSEAEMIEFSRKFDPQPAHIDRAFAATSSPHHIVASGWHICAKVMRMMCDVYLMDTANIGSPGVEYLRWLRPVGPGEPLMVRTIVRATRRSNSKPDRGLVKTRWIVRNEVGLIMVMEGWTLILLRNPSA